MISDACRAAEMVFERCGPLPLALVGDCSGSEVALGAGALIPACERLVLWSAPPVAAERGAMRSAKRRGLWLEYLQKLLRAGYLAPAGAPGGAAGPGGPGPPLRGPGRRGAGLAQRPRD